MHPPTPSLLFQSMILQCISKENVGILPGNQYSGGNPFSFLSVRQPDSLGRAARHYPFIFIYLFIYLSMCTFSPAFGSQLLSNSSLSSSSVHLSVSCERRLLWLSLYKCLRCCFENLGL